MSRPITVVGRERRLSPVVRGRVRRGVAVGVLAALSAGVLALAGPADAVKPDGAQVELGFFANYDYETPVTSGSWAPNDGSGNDLELVPFPFPDPNAPAAVGCVDDPKVGFGFNAASTSPSVPGSPERPKVSSGDTAEDLFTYVDQETLGDNASTSLGRNTQIGTSAAAKRLDERWPAGTRVSVVMFCYDSDSFDTADWTIVADAGGVAITSWLTFMTVADPANATKTSAGFALDNRVAPGVALSDSFVGSTGTLTARLTGSGGAALSNATGSVEFYRGTGTARTLAGTARVSATGTASLSLGEVPAGSQTVYEGVYVPDTAAGSTYLGATSPRYTVFGPTTTPPTMPPPTTDPPAAQVVTPTVAMTVSPTSYGRATTTTIAVQRSGAAATGAVALSLDGQAVGTAPLAAGAASVTLPATLSAGNHTLVAVYQGNATTRTATATAVATVVKASGAVQVKVAKAKLRKAVKAKITVTVPGTAVAALGTVQVKVGKTTKTATLGAGRATIKLPAFKSLGKAKVKVTYAGDANVAGAKKTATVTIVR